MTFNDLIDRRGTNSSKWDKMEQLYGVSAEGRAGDVDGRFRLCHCTLRH